MSDPDQVIGTERAPSQELLEAGRVFLRAQQEYEAAERQWRRTLSGQVCPPDPDVYPRLQRTRGEHHRADLKFSSRCRAEGIPRQQVLILLQERGEYG